MSVQENIQLVRKVYETAFIKHDFDAVGKYFSTDYVLHDRTQPDSRRGAEAFKEAHGAYLKGMQDHTITIDDQFGDNDRVVTRWTATGCQSGDLPEIPNRGGCFKVGGLTISRVFDGKIVEEWNEWDAAGLARQLAGD